MPASVFGGAGASNEYDKFIVLQIVQPKHPEPCMEYLDIILWLSLMLRT